MTNTSIYDARFPFKHIAAMTDDERERRMAAFLNRPPRNQRTRALVSSLAGDAETAAQIARERQQARDAIARKIAQQKRDKERYEAWVARGCPPSPSVPRKTRMAPGARKRREREAGFGSVSPRLQRIAEIQDMRCASCGGKMMLTVERCQQQATLDHVIPQCAGGRDAMNLVAMHNQCNHRKANRFPNGCELIWLAAVNARLCQQG